MRTGTETIVALATPPGVGALAIVRLSGDGVREMTERLLGRKLRWVPQRAFFVRLREGEREIDDAVMTFWEGPRSYTGEDVLEICVHGNPKIVEQVIAAYLRQGARLALPGEFTRRALQAGKLGLTQVEGLGDLFSASTERELANARSLLRGDLAKEMEAMREKLIEVLAQLEAYIDFPEEDIDPPTYGMMRERLNAVIERVERLLAGAKMGRVVRDGISAVIVGRPNVGKSSLFNLLLQERRAIVSHRPGTTRDVIDAECVIGDIRMRLLDTAGIREEADEIEAEGISRTKEAWDQAQLILHVMAADEDPELDKIVTAQLKLRPDQRLLRVLNKTDLEWHPRRTYPDYQHEFDCRISVAKHEGIESLGEKIKEIFISSQAAEASTLCLVNARQTVCLENAKGFLSRAILGLEEKWPPEIISHEMRAALSEVDELLGVTDHEEVLDRIFSQFCIGK